MDRHPDPTDRRSRPRPSARVGAGTLALAAVLALVPAACGSEDGTKVDAGSGGAAPSAFVGSTEGGAEVVVAVSAEGDVLFSWAEATCPDDDGDEEDDRVVNEIDPFDASGTLAEGAIEASSFTTEWFYDGDHVNHEVEISGSDDGGGRLSGTLALTRTSVNGQGEDLGKEPFVCEAEPVAWTAERSDDPQLGAAMFAFREAALGDTAAVVGRLEAGLDPEVVHPVRGTSLVCNLWAGYVPDGPYGEEEWSSEDDELDPVWFPLDSAPDTQEALEQAGVPEPEDGCE